MKKTKCSPEYMGLPLITKYSNSEPSGRVTERISKEPFLSGKSSAEMLILEAKAKLKKQLHKRIKEKILKRLTLASPRDA